MVDVSKIEVGDRITLGGEVEVVGVDRPPSATCVKVAINGLKIWITDSLITAHHPKPKPKPLAVGDRLRIGGSTETCEVVGAPRRTSEGQEEVALWSDVDGYFYEDVANILSWERVS